MREINSISPLHEKRIFLLSIHKTSDKKSYTYSFKMKIPNKYRYGYFKEV
jgi:hypothetical protein